MNLGRPISCTDSDFVTSKLVFSVENKDHPGQPKKGSLIPRAYYPDLAHSDHYLFQRMQDNLWGHRFGEEIEEWLNDWIEYRLDTFCRDDIRKLPER